MNRASSDESDSDSERLDLNTLSPRRERRLLYKQNETKRQKNKEKKRLKTKRALKMEKVMKRALQSAIKKIEKKTPEKMEENTSVGVASTSFSNSSPPDIIKLLSNNQWDKLSLVSLLVSGVSIKWELNSAQDGVQSMIKMSNSAAGTFEEDIQRSGDKSDSDIEILDLNEPTSVLKGERSSFKQNQTKKKKIKTEKKQNIKMTQDQKKKIKRIEDEKQKEKRSKAKDQKQMIKSTKDQKQMIKSTKDQKQMIKSTKDQKQMIKSTKDQKQKIKSTKDQKQKIKSTKDQKQMIKSTKDQKQMIKSTKDQKQMIKSTKEQKSKDKNKKIQKKKLKKKSSIKMKNKLKYALENATKEMKKKVPKTMEENTSIRVASTSVSNLYPPDIVKPLSNSNWDKLSLVSLVISGVPKHMWPSDLLKRLNLSPKLHKMLMDDTGNSGRPPHLTLPPGFITHPSCFENLMSLYAGEGKNDINSDVAESEIGGQKIISTEKLEGTEEVQTKHEADNKGGFDEMIMDVNESGIHEQTDLHTKQIFGAFEQAHPLPQDSENNLSASVRSLIEVDICMKKSEDGNIVNSPINDHQDENMPNNCNEDDGNNTSNLTTKNSITPTGEGMTSVTECNSFEETNCENFLASIMESEPQNIFQTVPMTSSPANEDDGNNTSNLTTENSITPTGEGMPSVTECNSFEETNCENFLASIMESEPQNIFQTVPMTSSPANEDDGNNTSNLTTENSITPTGEGMPSVTECNSFEETNCENFLASIMESEPQNIFQTVPMTSSPANEDDGNNTSNLTTENSIILTGEDMPSVTECNSFEETNCENFLASIMESEPQNIFQTVPMTSSPANEDDGNITSNLTTENSITPTGEGMPSVTECNSFEETNCENFLASLLESEPQNIFQTVPMTSSPANEDDGNITSNLTTENSITPTGEDMPSVTECNSFEEPNCENFLASLLESESQNIFQTVPMTSSPATCSDIPQDISNKAESPFNEASFFENYSTESNEIVNTLHRTSLLEEGQIMENSEQLHSVDVNYIDEDIESQVEAMLQSTWVIHF